MSLSMLVEINVIINACRNRGKRCAPEPKNGLGMWEGGKPNEEEIKEQEGPEEVRGRLSIYLLTHLLFEVTLL